MIIGNSTALFLLLLIPLIIILHILLRRMEPRNVSSLMIWERVRKKMRYRFPSILLLLLQILLVLFLTLALSEIQIPMTIPMRRENSVLIIDNSASMSVIEEGKSRLDDAKDKAVNVVRGSLGEIMVITSSYPPQVINSYSRDKDELIKAIRSIPQTDLRNGIEEVMKMANASLMPQGSIIMISDGAFNYVPSETDNFKFIRGGKEFRDNSAITDFHLREKTDTDSYELYLSLVTYSLVETPYTLSIYKSDELVVEEAGVLIPGQQERKIFEITSESQNEIRAELNTDSDDLLKSDNTASAFINSKLSKRILFITPGNFFLDQALQSIPEIRVEQYTGMLDEVDPVIYSSSGIPIQQIPDNYDLVIYDRVPPLQNDGAGRFLYIDVLPSGIRGDNQKIIPQAASFTMSHPVTDSVDLSRVSIIEARTAINHPNIKELITGGNTGLLYSYEDKYLKYLYIPFDLVDSDLPLRASFPVLMKNAVNWLTEGYTRKDILQSRTGDMLSTGSANPGFTESIIKMPSQKDIQIEGTSFYNSTESGLYRLEYGDDFLYHSVNIASLDESDISARFPEVTEEDREEKTGEYKFPIITILLILSFLILIIEWFVQEEKW